MRWIPARGFFLSVTFIIAYCDLSFAALQVPVMTGSEPDQV